MLQGTKNKFTLGRQRISFIFIGEIFGDISLKYSRQFILDYLLRSQTHFALGFDLERKRTLKGHIDQLSCAQVMLAAEHPAVLNSIKKDFTPQNGLPRPHFTAEQQLEMFKKYIEIDPEHKIELALYKAKVAMGVFDDNTIDFLKDMDCRTKNYFFFADYTYDPATGIPYKISAKEISKAASQQFGNRSGTVVLFTGIRNTSYFAASLAAELEKNSPSYDYRIVTSYICSEYSSSQFCDIYEIIEQERTERKKRVPAIGKMEDLINEFYVFAKDHGKERGFDFRNLTEIFEACSNWQSFIPELKLPLPLSDLKGLARKDKLLNNTEFSVIDNKNTLVKFSHTALQNQRFMKALSLTTLQIEISEESIQKLFELQNQQLGIVFWSSTHSSMIVYHESKKTAVENILNTNYSLFREI